MAIHPMNPMHPHASSCIACIRMPLHVSTCPTRVPSVRPPSRHKAPGVQHPSGPHAIRSSELDCCQSYSTPPSKQVRASRRTATSVHSSQHRTRTVTHTAVYSHMLCLRASLLLCLTLSSPVPLSIHPSLGRLFVLMYPPLPFRRIFLLVFFPFSIFPLRFSS